MYRAVFTILAIAGLSSCLSHMEQAQGEHHVASSWVRTADGWEHIGVLQPQYRSQATSAPHPLIVAFFQMGASVFVLLAFPGPQAAARRQFSSSDHVQPVSPVRQRRKSRRHIRVSAAD